MNVPRTDDAGKTVIVKPVVNAVRILRYLAETGEPARASTISRRLSINSSTCFNILRTLTQEGMVAFDPAAKSYAPGAGLARLVEQFLTEGQRVMAAAPLMADLACDFSVSVALWKRLGSDRIVLVKNVASPTALRIEMSEGQRLPLLMGATGRLFASRLDLNRAELASMFGPLRWQRPLCFDEYMLQVEAASLNGWAVDDGYFTAGVRTLAVPVEIAEVPVLYALVGITFATSDEANPPVELTRAMRAVAEKLARILL